MNADEEILEHTIRGLSVLRSGSNMDRAMAALKLERELTERLESLRSPESASSTRPPLLAARRTPRAAKSSATPPPIPAS